MSQKRKLDEFHDPDYPRDPNETKKSRPNNVLELTREERLERIRAIVRREFQKELAAKEEEITKIDNRLAQAKQLMQRVRYAVIANFYTSKKLELCPAEMQQATAGLCSKELLEGGQSAIHPAVKSAIKSNPVELDEILRTRPKREAAKTATSSISDRCRRKKDQKKAKQLANGTLEAETTSTSGESPGDVKKVPRYIDPVMKEKLIPKLNAARGRNQTKHLFVVGNTSKYIGDEMSLDGVTHKWLVYVRTKDSVPIERIISKVRFFLHPSYKPNDIVDICTPPFQLSRRGWGEFPIRVQLIFHDAYQQRPVQIVHNLVLDKTLTGLQTMGAETLVEMWLNSDESDETHLDQKAGPSLLSNEPQENEKSMLDIPKEVLSDDLIMQIKIEKEEIIPNDLMTKLNPDSKNLHAMKTEMANDELKIAKETQGNQLNGDAQQSQLQPNIPGDITIKHASPIKLSTQNVVPPPQITPAPIPLLPMAENLTDQPPVNPLAKVFAKKIVKCVSKDGNVKYIQMLVNQTPNPQKTANPKNVVLVKKANGQTQVLNARPNPLVLISPPSTTSPKPIGKNIILLNKNLTPVKMPIMQPGTNATSMKKHADSQSNPNPIQNVIRPAVQQNILTGQNSSPGLQATTVSSSLTKLVPQDANIQQQTTKVVSIPNVTRITYPSGIQSVATVTTASSHPSFSTSSSAGLVSQQKSPAFVSKNQVIFKNGKMYIIDPLQSKIKQENKKQESLLKPQISLLKPIVTNDNLKNCIRNDAKSVFSHSAIATDHDYTTLIGKSPSPNTITIHKSPSTFVSATPNRIMAANTLNTSRINVIVNTIESEFRKSKAKIPLEIAVPPPARNYRKELETSFIASNFVSVRHACEFLLKHLPLFGLVVEMSTEKHPFAFIVKDEAAFRELSVPKQKAMEWLRAKYIKQILQKHPIIQNLKAWTTKEIILFARHYAYTPVIETNTSLLSSSAEDAGEIKNAHSLRELIQKEIHREYYDEQTLTLNHDVYGWLNDVRQKISGDICLNDAVIDVENSDDEDDLTKKVLKESPHKVPNNKIFLPIDEKYSNEVSLITDSCNSIGIRLKLEEIIPNVFHSTAQLALAQSLRCFMEDLLRRSIAIKTCSKGESSLSTTLIQSEDIKKAILGRSQFDFLTNSDLGVAKAKQQEIE